MSAHAFASHLYEQTSRFAEDLYPGRYTPSSCQEIAEMGEEILAKRAEKGSTIVAHNYLYPEYHLLPGVMVGDSLGLSKKVRDMKAKRVDFQSVFFMGATAKIIAGDATRVFAPDSPATLGCSLVFGTDLRVVRLWKKLNPGGVIVTYVNSDAYVKSLSDYISTSSNTDAIIVAAARENPGKRILVMPDKYLGYVMRTKAAAKGVDPKMVDVYEAKLGQWNACCYVHEKIGDDAPELALEKYPNAELLVHPECGCASSCLHKLNCGIIPHGKAYFKSTEQMYEHARDSDCQEFIVATEKGMVFRLRKDLPHKKFYPVSLDAECKYMKANTFDKLLRSLNEDRIEIVFCNDCCDPEHPYEDDQVVHIQRSVAAKAKAGIDRMLAIT